MLKQIYTDFWDVRANGRQCTADFVLYLLKKIISCKQCIGNVDENCVLGFSVYTKLCFLVIIMCLWLDYFLVHTV